MWVLTLHEYYTILHTEWNSVCFVLFLGKADYCRRKDKKLPQRGQFCAYMRHKVIEGSVISSIITIWKPVCLLFFNLFLTFIICVYVHTFARCAHVYNNERWRKWNDKLFKTVKNETKMKLSFWNIWQFRKWLVLLHSLLRNRVLLKATKERVLWKILHKQTSSTRSG